MLEKVKLSLRITTNKLDSEITDLIEACKIDLSIGGVLKIDEADAIVQRAIILYCKAHFGLSNADSEKYLSSYEMLRTNLKLCGDYNVIQ